MYATNFAQVGANIQKELDNKSMTQQNLADALSIPKQMIGKIIKGERAINVNELSKIASILDTTTDALLSINLESESLESVAFMEIKKEDKLREKLKMLESFIDEIQLLDCLNYTPTAKIEEHSDAVGNYYCSCSNCGNSWWHKYTERYCSNCGAKIEEN